jgi:2-polyprenyl-6-methoxyphenol hydroxylase-like FAD-dependent oxidoreductase
MDVLIVGAGPTGLLLAGDLASAGVSCAVLEARQGESNLTRAFAVHARTLEQLDARGVADELAQTGPHIGALWLFGKLEVDLTHLPSRFPYLLVTPQYETERVLGERARAHGAEIRMGAEVTGLRQDGDGVDVDVREPGGATATLRAAYVVGADGVRSTVRDALGVPFPGHSAIRSVMLADVRLTSKPPDVLALNAVGDAFAFLVPFGDGFYRAIAWNRRHQVPDTAPVDLDELREVTQRALGTDYGMHDPRWMSRFHSDERQVPSYRAGRVFLAGDAAHVHSPAGGQGMNTSIQDAANLGWKLAAEINGWAPGGLLDSYHAERHPVGRSVLRSSGALLRMALTGPRPLRAARSVVAQTATHLRPVSRRVAGVISGTGIAYPAPSGADPLTGRRAPDIPLKGGRRLYEALRGGRFLLVSPPSEPAPVQVGGFDDRLELVEAAGPTRKVVLVRPDGYVAWATSEPHTHRPAAAVHKALTDWCGASTSTTSPPLPTR